MRASNEDCFVIADLENAAIRTNIELSEVRLGGRAPAWIFGVADGMGGHGHGAVASQIALSAAISAIAAELPDKLALHDRDAAVMRLLEHATLFSERELRNVAHERGIESARPGTTLTIALVTSSTLYVVHGGDSRCYLLRDGELVQLTHDDTVAQELFELSHIEEDEIATSPFSHVLSNAVGGSPQEFMPQVGRVELKRGDAIVLCSDGLIRHMDDGTIGETITTIGRAAPAVDHLVYRALEAGGHDNITLAIAQIG